jgi:hypothetical protein
MFSTTPIYPKDILKVLVKNKMEIEEAEAEKPTPPTPRRNQRNRKKRFSNLNDTQLAKKVSGKPEEWKPPQKRKVTLYPTWLKLIALFLETKKNEWKTRLVQLGSRNKTF